MPRAVQAVQAVQAGSAGSAGSAGRQGGRFPCCPVALSRPSNSVTARTSQCKTVHSSIYDKPPSLPSMAHLRGPLRLDGELENWPFLFLLPSLCLADRRSFDAPSDAPIGDMAGGLERNKRAHLPRSKEPCASSKRASKDFLSHTRTRPPHVQGIVTP